MTKSKIRLSEVRRSDQFRQADARITQAVGAMPVDYAALCVQLRTLIDADSGVLTPSGQLRQIGRDVEFCLHQNDAWLAFEDSGLLIRLVDATQGSLGYCQHRYPNWTALAFHAIVLLVLCSVPLVLFARVEALGPSLSLLVAGFYGLWLWLGPDCTRGK